MILEEPSLIKGSEITSFFLIVQADIKYKRDGTSTFLQLVLGHKSQKIRANIWNDVENCEKIYKTGVVVKVKGIVEEYNNENFINIDKIRLSDKTDEIDINDLLPKYEGDILELEKAFLGFITTIDDKYLRELLKSIFEEEQFFNKFKRSPAGKKWHHNYISGLLEHTFNLVKLSEECCKIYPQLNRDLTVTGAFLHDIGKVVELSSIPVIDYTDEGRLVGHIAAGAIYVSEKIGKIKDFPEDLKNKVLHMILSHQGENEKGSPVVPMFREALLIYFLDEIDSKLNAFDRIIKNEKKDGAKWSKFVNLIDRYIYLE